MKSHYKGPIGTHQRSFEQYHPRHTMASPSPGLRVRDPNAKLQLLLSQELVKLRKANLANTFTGSSEQKPVKNGEKRQGGRIRGLPKFFGYPLLSQERVNLRTSNFVCTCPLKISGKVAVGVLREFGKFSGHPYIGRIARSSLW